MKQEASAKGKVVPVDARKADQGNVERGVETLAARSVSAEEARNVQGGGQECLVFYLGGIPESKKK